MALVNKKNAILSAPTGSGKTPVIYIALRVLEIVTNRDDLVALGAEPTENIIKNKVSNPMLPSGSISMSGKIEVSFKEQNQGCQGCNKKVQGHHKADCAVVSDLKVSKQVKVIYGYQESWSHEVGRAIIEKRAESNQIAFIFYDEAHTNLPKFWGKFRKEMYIWDQRR